MVRRILVLSLVMFSLLSGAGCGVTDPEPAAGSSISTRSCDNCLIECHVVGVSGKCYKRLGGVCMCVGDVVGGGGGENSVHFEK